MALHTPTPDGAEVNSATERVGEEKTEEAFTTIDLSAADAPATRGGALAATSDDDLPQAKVRRQALPSPIERGRHAHLPPSAWLLSASQRAR